MVDGRRDYDHRSGGNTMRNVLLAVAAIAVLLLILFAVGVFDVDTQGDLEAPEVQVEGGSLPDVDADAADVSVGTETQTVEVPVVEVNAAEADEE